METAKSSRLIQTTVLHFGSRRQVSRDTMSIKKFVWDTSALLSIKEPNQNGYSPGYSLWKDVSLNLYGPYHNFLPAIAYFEWQASISRKHRNGEKVLRELYILDEFRTIYPIDEKLIQASDQLVTNPGFDKLRGADLIFACIAKLEDAFLVTLDDHFNKVGSVLRVVNLNNSRDNPNYHQLIES